VDTALTLPFSARIGVKLALHVTFLVNALIVVAAIASRGSWSGGSFEGATSASASACYVAFTYCFGG